MTDPPVWLNGALLRRNAARVDPLAQGILTGLGVYDAMLWRDGRLVFPERHLRRLAHGATRLGLEMPAAAEIFRAVADLAAAQALTDGRVRITLAGGPSTSVQPAAEGENIALITLTPLTAQKASAALTVTPFRRNEHSPLAGIKHTACAESILAQRAVMAAGFDEALFLNTAGEICEGAFSNCFFVRSGRVLTPPLASGCLPGVVREVVLELCACENIPAEECTLTREELPGVQEMFLTSSIRGIQSVERLDNLFFPAPGEVTKLLSTRLEAAMAGPDLAQAGHR
jgi:branched-chain amino acid aminotransferase